MVFLSNSLGENEIGRKLLEYFSYVLLFLLSNSLKGDKQQPIIAGFSEEEQNGYCKRFT